MGIKWLIFIFVLSACTPVIEQAKELSAKVVKEAEWTICRAAPIGTIIDRYGQTTERAREYKAYCLGGSEVNIVAPENSGVSR